jgi:hypothetical protein
MHNEPLVVPNVAPVVLELPPSLAVLVEPPSAPGPVDDPAPASVDPPSVASTPGNVGSGDAHAEPTVPATTIPQMSRPNRRRVQLTSRSYRVRPKPAPRS